MAEHIKFPYGKRYFEKGKNNSAYLGFNDRYFKKFNGNLDTLQKVLDSTVATYLMEYVSKKTGVQELSIKISSIPGSGLVHINVPYAYYQAYSPRIKKKSGKRGKKPFERMVSANKKNIEQQLVAYSRRLNGQ